MKFFRLSEKFKNLNLYIGILTVIINIVILVFLYNFMDKNVYKAIVPDSDSLVTQLKNSDDINMAKFEIIMNKINTKKAGKSPASIRPIF